ncbi:H-NS family nucleoid-associated regulatory protein [Gammaproteobacteria bacterium]|nr:H-NS family nucleoid-associated regulatory protein [Gammaproteobacteria bacterium]
MLEQLNGLDIDQLKSLKLKISEELEQRRLVDTVKYRHPHAKNLTWDGEGERPQWVQDWLRWGGQLSQISVLSH